MKKLQKAAIQLMSFIDLPSILEIEVELIDVIMAESINQDLVERLRKYLLAIAHNPAYDEISKAGKQLNDVAFEFLLALAEHSPINTEDPVTAEVIEVGFEVFVSSGHQFDIRELIGWDNFRRGNFHYGCNWRQAPLMNIATNSPFSKKDVMHIEEIALKKAVLIDNTYIPASADQFNMQEQYNEDEVIFAVLERDNNAFQYKCSEAISKFLAVVSYIMGTLFLYDVSYRAIKDIMPMPYDELIGNAAFVLCNVLSCIVFEHSGIMAFPRKANLVEIFEQYLPRQVSDIACRVSEALENLSDHAFAFFNNEVRARHALENNQRNVPELN